MMPPVWGPPPQFAARTPVAGPSRRQVPVRSAPPSAPSRAPLPKQTAIANYDNDDDKTHITPARLSPLMQRLTPKVPVAPSQQMTAMLTLEPEAPKASVQSAVRLGPAPQQSKPVAQQTAEKTQVLSVDALSALPRSLLKPSASPPVAETVIIQAPAVPDIHAEATMVAASPLRALSELRGGAVSATRPDEFAHRLTRPIDDADPSRSIDNTDSIEPAPQRQSVHLPAQAVGPETSIGARKLASGPQLLMATTIDAVVISATGWASAATEMLVFDGSWPADRTGFEGLAVWMHMYAQIAVHTLLVTTAFALVYTALGAHSGRTLGRAVLGLTLVRASGDKPSWPWALWHASASAFATALWGAGLFWSLVDRQRRFVGNIASQSVVCLG